jgi:hypothetical protein
MKVSTGTMINPPPMPNNPAKKPTTVPNSKYAGHHSTSNFAVWFQ